MDENKFKFFNYCTFLLIDDDNHSKIFISKKNKYYIEYGDNRSLHVKISNKFKDIRKSYEINVIDITDNYYNIDKPNIIKCCTILLIDDIYTGRIYISEKNMYYIRYVDDDDCDELVYYNKVLNDFEHFVSDRNNIVNSINNDKRKHNITLLVDDYKIFICQNDIY